MLKKVSKYFFTGILIDHKMLPRAKLESRWLWNLKHDQ